MLRFASPGDSIGFKGIEPMALTGNNPQYSHTATRRGGSIAISPSAVAGERLGGPSRRLF